MEGPIFSPATREEKGGIRVSSRVPACVSGSHVQDQYKAGEGGEAKVGDPLRGDGIRELRLSFIKRRCN